ncbi:hypothetical protein [Alteromonas gracilis]|uniref:hypothetical protein n=1 Tax=Alteromonas gracilis TaxID=1479524 RepID=UPI002FE05BD5
MTVLIKANCYRSQELIDETISGSSSQTLVKNNELGQCIVQKMVAHPDLHRGPADYKAPMASL